MDHPRAIAAALTAAIIQAQSAIQGSRVAIDAGFATKTFFEVLDAITAELERRVQASAMGPRAGEAKNVGPNTH
jgi:hypothetical protein